MRCFWGKHCTVPYVFRCDWMGWLGCISRPICVCESADGVQLIIDRNQIHRTFLPHTPHSDRNVTEVDRKDVRVLPRAPEECFGSRQARCCASPVQHPSPHPTSLISESTSETSPSLSFLELTTTTALPP